MSYIVFDAETYYDREYSLKNMTPVEYLLDSRFKLLGAGIIDPAVTDRPFWMEGEALSAYLRGLNKRKPNLTIISHNSLFDACLLHWHYAVDADLWIDTLGMARAMLYAFTGDASLKACAAHLGLPEKGNAVFKMSGKTKEMAEAEGIWEEFKSYAMHDAFLCEQVFKALMPQFPKDEFKIMDMVLRCAVEPRFVIDRDILLTHLAELKQEKQNLLTRAGILDRKELLSNERFANALRMLGVDPPTKTSPATGLTTFAFAKTDPGMKGLIEHRRPDVQALANARIGIKSTLEESRAETLLKISMLPWPDRFNPASAPIPLRYSGAHTHRLSGDWKLNAQNWTKSKVNPDGTKVTGRLRLAHKAPPGHLVVKADASQIEARIVAWLAGEVQLVEAFREGKDIYSEFASENIYGYPVGKHTVDERFVGKSAILGLGFQVGAPKFQKEIAAKSYVTLGHTIDLSLEKANAIVAAYRTKYARIPEAWNHCKVMLDPMAKSSWFQHAWGPVEFQHQKILLPNGHFLYYPDMKQDRNEDTGFEEWTCKYGKERKKLFGGKIWENIVQALARIITMNAAVRMRQHGFKLAHQIHDDLIYVVPEKEAEFVAHLLVEEMSEARDWYTGLPLAAEAGIGPSYGECK